jgi:hypothetical protein
MGSLEKGSLRAVPCAIATDYDSLSVEPLVVRTPVGAWNYPRRHFGVVAIEAQSFWFLREENGIERMEDGKNTTKP